MVRGSRGLELADSDSGPRTLFRYPLRLSDEEPHDPPAYLSLIPNWSVGDTFTLAEGQQVRIVAIDRDIAQEFKDAGFDTIVLRRGPATAAPDASEA